MGKKNKKKEKIEVYKYEKIKALGDIISCVSHANLRCNGGKIYFSDSTVERAKNIIREVQSVLRTTNEIVWTSKPHTIYDHIVQQNPDKYLETKIRWRDRTPLRNITSPKIISYQFKTSNNPNWNKERFFTDEKYLRDLVFKYLGKIEFIELGLPMTIKEDVEILSKSMMYFGIDSGISHLAHCVGTPTFLKYFQNQSGYGARKDIHTYHPNKEYKTFDKIEELFPIIDDMISQKAKK